MPAAECTYEIAALLILVPGNNAGVGYIRALEHSGGNDVGSGVGSGTQ